MIPAKASENSPANIVLYDNKSRAKSVFEDTTSPDIEHVQKPKKLNFRPSQCPAESPINIGKSEIFEK